jgi:hypothetical protein
MDQDRTIQLTAFQRLGLENLLGEQRGKREEMRVFHNIRRKVKLTPEERQRYMRPLPNGQFILDDIALTKANGFEATFTDDETRRLIKLGDSIELVCGQMDWLEPLLQALEEK